MSLALKYNLINIKYYSKSAFIFKNSIYGILKKKKVFIVPLTNLLIL